jgi:hypothetical protein
MSNKYNNEFESATDRAGFGEFANTINGIHLQEPSERQIEIREAIKDAGKITKKGLLEQFNEVDHELKMEPKLDIVDNLINLIPTHVEYYFQSEWITVKLVKVDRDTNTIDIMMPTTNHVRNTVFDKIRPVSNSGKPLNKWRNIKSNMTKEEVKQILGEPIHINVDRDGEKWSYNKESNYRYGSNLIAEAGELIFKTEMVSGRHQGLSGAQRNDILRAIIADKDLTERNRMLGAMLSEDIRTDQEARLLKYWCEP